MMNMQNMMKQAQKLQKQMEKAKLNWLLQPSLENQHKTWLLLN